MYTAKVYRVEFIKDAAGDFLYDEAAIRRFRDKMLNKMKRQNDRIAVDPSRYKGYSICDPETYADFQVRLFKHNFRLTRNIEITK